MKTHESEFRVAVFAAVVGAAVAFGVMFQDKLDSAKLTNGLQRLRRFFEPIELSM